MKDGVTRCKDVLLKAEENPVLLGEAQGELYHTLPYEASEWLAGSCAVV